MISDLTYDNESLVAFCEKHRLRKLALFGSATRDDFTAESDVDVLIELPQQHNIGFFKFFAMEQELSEIFHRKVDLNTYGGMQGAVGQEILNSAKVIYEPTKNPAGITHGKI